MRRIPSAECTCRAPRPPREENVLYLNGESSGLVNNACFPSTVAPSYAPAGQASSGISCYVPSHHYTDLMQGIWSTAVSVQILPHVLQLLLASS